MRIRVRMPRQVAAERCQETGFRSREGVGSLGHHELDVSLAIAVFVGGEEVLGPALRAVDDDVFAGG